jgi:6-phosphogluconolactonase (cycloisomerase 2 family)
VSTGGNFQSPWQLAVNGNTLYATTANTSSGGVTTCTIGSGGALSNCAESAGSGTAGIAVNSSYAYVGVGPNAVDVCTVGALGALTGCVGTGSTFSGLDGISLANGYAYVANQSAGTVSVCQANSDGSLAPCAVSTIGTGVVVPTSVAINGAQAYVNDLNGNIYLCSVSTSGGALQNCAVSNGGTAFNFGIQIAIH